MHHRLFSARFKLNRPLPACVSVSHEGLAEGRFSANDLAGAGTYGCHYYDDPADALLGFGYRIGRFLCFGHLDVHRDAFH